MQSFMKHAIALSIENVHNGGGPFGAVIVKDDNIIAEGVNRVTATNDPTAHAEIVAIRNACKALNSFQLSNCILYSSCEPCPMCFGAIYWARPQAVYFSNTKDDAAAINFDDSFIYAQLALEPPKRSIPFIHLDIPQADEAFALWQKKTNKIHY